MSWCVPPETSTLWVSQNLNLSGTAEFTFIVTVFDPYGIEAWAVYINPWSCSNDENTNILIGTKNESLSTGFYYINAVQDKQNKTLYKVTVALNLTTPSEYDFLIGAFGLDSKGNKIESSELKLKDYLRVIISE